MCMHAVFNLIFLPSHWKLDIAPRSGRGSSRAATATQPKPISVSSPWPAAASGSAGRGRCGLRSLGLVLFGLFGSPAGQLARKAASRLVRARRLSFPQFFFSCYICERPNNWFLTKDFGFWQPDSVTKISLLTIAQPQKPISDVSFGPFYSWKLFFLFSFYFFFASTHH